jgi:hypothetical protein
MTNPSSNVLIPDPQYLATLAAYQTEALTYIGQADTAVAGLSTTVTSTHGPTCAPFTTAFADALQARAQANVYMEQACEAIARALNRANTAFIATDEGGAEKIQAAYE